MINETTCANCRHKLDVGVDTIRVEEGVMGMKGFVPLDRITYFCCEKCIKEYFDYGDLPSIPSRIP